MSKNLLFTNIIALISLFSVSGCGGGSSGGSGTASIYQGDWRIVYTHLTGFVVTLVATVDNNGVLVFDAGTCTFPASNPPLKITNNALSYTDFQWDCGNGCIWTENGTFTFNGLNNVTGTASGSVLGCPTGNFLWSATVTGTKL